MGLRPLLPLHLHGATSRPGSPIPRGRLWLSQLPGPAAHNGLLWRSRAPNVGCLRSGWIRPTRWGRAMLPIYSKVVVCPLAAACSRTAESCRTRSLWCFRAQIRTPSLGHLLCTAWLPLWNAMVTKTVHPADLLCRLKEALDGVDASFVHRASGLFGTKSILWSVRKQK